MATYEVTIGDYVYTLNDYGYAGTVKVKDVTKTSYADLPFTVTYNGHAYNIYSIAECYKNCTNLITAPKLPNGPNYMGKCFEGCTSLTTAPAIPNSVTDMSYCFQNCTNLETAPAIPSNVTNMSFCFNNCTSLTTAPTIPSSVINMKACFQNCTNLEAAPTIPSNVTDMSWCFYGCASITASSTIPSAVTTMRSCFNGCISLITVSKIQSGVIDMYCCFQGCTNLTTAPTIPSSVTNMYGCFDGCTNLETAPIIPNSVTNMEGCFESCTSLTTAPVIPSSVTNMKGCFNKCTNLTTAPIIPSNITNMYCCFQDCTSLTTAPEIPSSVTDMYCCFNGCTNLTTAPVIPSNVTNMEGCFQNCTSLTTAPEIPNNVTNVYCCFNGCTNLTTAPIIPNSVTDMRGCFQKCTSLTTAPEIPSSITDMSFCFYGCTNLTTAPIIPSSVIIMRSCFRNCTSLGGDLQVNNNPQNYTSIFDGTTSHIRIIPQYSTISQEGISKWTSIADAYGNVDIFIPSLLFQSLSAYRVNNSGDTSESEEGAYTLLEAVYTFNGLEGDLVTKTVKANESIIASTWTESTMGTIITARTWIRQEVDQQTTYIVSLSDDYNHVETRTIIVTRVEALLDFLDGSKGMGIAFGTIATHPGFYCGMPANVIDANNVMRPLFDFFYPIGSYYETSDTSFDPNVTWGGTWHLEVEGQVHVSGGTNYEVKSANTDTVNADDTVGIKQDGSKDAIIPYHDHSTSITQPTFNTPNHTHGAYKYVSDKLAGGSVGARIYNPGGGTGTLMNTTSSGGGVACSRTTNVAVTVNHTGSSVTDANMMPYIVVNRWHRVA